MKKHKIIKTMGLILFATVLFYTVDVHAAGGFKFEDQYVKCGGAEFPYGAVVIVQNVVNLIKIAIPILLIVLGMLDFLKAVIANDEKQMAEKKNHFIKRIIAGVAIFFVVAIVQFVFGHVVQGNEGKDALSCVACFIGSEDDCKIGTSATDGASAGLTVGTSK